MTVGYGEIRRVLDGARRRQVEIVLLAAVAAGAAAVLLVLFTGAAALALGARPGVRGLSVGGAGLAAAAAAAWAIRSLLRTAWSEDAAARTVAAGEPGLRSDLVSSVEFERERPAVQASGRWSLALVDAHVDRTAERARALDLGRAIPDRPARLAALALLGVVVLHGLAFLFAGGPLARAYGRVLAGDRGSAAAPPVEPITGDVELTFAYPAYMRREPRTLSGTGGEIRAPKGTEVTLRTRADRDVKAAELAVDLDLAAPEAPAKDAKDAKRPAAKRYALAVAGARGLSGRLVVEDGGSYRFRFLDGRGKLVAEGPPIPIVVEPDLPPVARITRPDREIEVEPGAVLHVDWQAEDDVGLAEVALVVKGPAGEERRQVLRKPDGVRRDGGTADLDLVPERLGEGDRLSYWLEAVDGDVVSGPKKAVSETHVVKIYSEAEHRREVLERARAVFEQMVSLLGDRLEAFAAGPLDSLDRLAVADQLDVRTRHLHEALRATAREIRKDRAGPREVAAALENVGAQLRVAEQRVVSSRIVVSQAYRVRITPDRASLTQMKYADAILDGELEKGILYLEQLLDKQRAEDLVRLAKDLADKRRDLAGLLEKYKAAPTEAARKELLARISRMKDRVKELLARMSEMSKGFNDEHMNREALAEMAKSQDLVGGLDEIEKLLAKGDVEGAMKQLDAMASTMDKMLAGLKGTAGMPDEKAQALMKEMLAFKDQLEKVKGEQERAAGETEKIREKYRSAIQKRLKDAEDKVKRLEKLASEAKKDVDAAQPGVTYRAEPEFDESRAALEGLSRALASRELGAAYDTVQRATPAVERLSRFLEEDLALSEQNPAFTRRPPDVVREAQRSASRAVPKVREVRDELAKLFPDPKSTLSPGEQQKLDQLAKRQSELEQKAGDLQRKLGDLMQKAPVFPPNAQGQLGESRGHMGQAASELGQKNPQRGHGEQELALDALSRFQKGLDEAAKKGKGQGGGMGFPYPFGDQGGGGEESGDGRDPAREKVNIPGAEAYKVPEEFRKDLLDAMKQGAPERYKGEVQRYYEELVK